MRSIEEQMKEIKRRKGIYQAMKDLRKKIIAEVISAFGCVIMMIAVICFLPELRQVSEQAPVRPYGSLILALPAAGYVLIALLSFALGVAVTLLCQHWKQRKDLERARTAGTRKEERARFSRTRCDTAHGMEREIE